MSSKKINIERVQLGARVEKKLVKVLKAIAETGDMTLGELLEDIVLHSFEGVSTFPEEAQKKIILLREVYGLNYKAHDSYKFSEAKT
ncbi:MAG: hypothetical protein HQL32_10575 [Planctomycetes bacterium]|nr:hypothetical protein [Planctomycetota bacterium]